MDADEWRQLGGSAAMEGVEMIVELRTGVRTRRVCKGRGVVLKTLWMRGEVCCARYWMAALVRKSCDRKLELQWQALMYNANDSCIRDFR